MKLFNLLKISTLVLILVTNIFPQTTLLINEIVSSNSVLEDEDGITQDWFEIYNNTESVINLTNYSISDDSEDPRKWIFPDVNIDPGVYLVIFASGKDRYGDELHTNFSIKAEGEVLILSNSEEEIIDQVEPTTIPSGYSLGRNINIISEWLFYSIPTPGQENNTSGFTALSEEPIFSDIGGFYINEVNLIISTVSGIADIYYTTDGSEPTINSDIYTSPILINNTTVIRSRTFTNNLFPSQIITNTYFINENSTLPVISLSTDPDNFFDDEIGIYVEGINGIPGNCVDYNANWNQDWERPIHIEFFEQDLERKFSIDAGVKIHGGCSRSVSQKSLRIIARGEYGSSKIPYKIFPNLPYEEYNAIILRNSGNDYNRTFMRDAMMHTLVEDLDFEKMAYRPAIVFLNGNYWGIHNIRERIENDYLAQHHDVDKENIDLLEGNHSVIQGDNTAFLAMHNFIKNESMALEANYLQAASLMDIPSYTKYMLSEMYFANTDWFPTNMKFWRSNNPISKWRWIMFDTDQGFALYSSSLYAKNMIDNVSDENRFPSFIYTGLMENQNFRNQFLNTYADFVNTIFKPNRVIHIIDSIKSLIEVEMPRHIQKWRNPGGSWEGYVQALRDFANLRLPYMTEDFIEEYGISGISIVDLSINNDLSGTIKLNTLTLSTFPWTGEYFQGIPITLEAIPKPGYRFVGWSGDIQSAERIITYIPSASNSITAEFELDNQAYPIVINEINYNSPDVNDGDPERPDWIELYNNSDEPVDLSGWQFKDEGAAFIIPNGTQINGREYLVLAENYTAFQFHYPSVTKILNASFEFGLGGGGEEIALYSLNGTLVDTLEYDDKAPWPTEPDGNGPTLELVHPVLDNSVGDSWRSSNIDAFGSPGVINDSFRDIYEPVEPPKIVINEINYNSPDEIVGEPVRPDWIELYNNSDDPVDLSGWQFKDEDYTFVIPGSTVLNPNEYLVLADTVSNFQFYYPSVTNLLNVGFEFGLSGGGELISLYNAESIIVDFVEYDDADPWPIQPDGNGPTLELIHPDFDNELPENWSASSIDFGSPGVQNGALLSQTELSLKVFLEGAYLNSSLMSSSASIFDNFPLSQPFNNEPWNYQGTESISEIPNDEITDWVLVELRSDDQPEPIIVRKAAFLKSNGNIVDLDGQSNLIFYGLDESDYFIVIHHRNHLPVMSNDSILFSNP